MISQDFLDFLGFLRIFLDFSGFVSIFQDFFDFLNFQKFFPVVLTPADL